MKLWILGMHEQFSLPLDKCNSQGFLQVKLLYHCLSTHQYNFLNHLQLENIDLVIEQTSINPQHNSLVPYHLQSDNNYYLKSLHNNMSNHFKQLNRKKCISFWCFDSAFAHIWFTLIVNCEWTWTEHSSQKNPKNTSAVFVTGIQSFALLLFAFIWNKYLFKSIGLYDNFAMTLSYKLKSQDQT